MDGWLPRPDVLYIRLDDNYVGLIVAVLKIQPLLKKRPFGTNE